MRLCVVLRVDRYRLYIKYKISYIYRSIEQLAAPGAAPVGDVTVASVLRQLGPRAPGLLHVDPREIGLEL